MKKILTGTFLTLAAVLIFAIGCVKKIAPGYVGMVYSANGLKGEVLQQGWNFVMPWEKVTEYNVSLEQAYLSKDRREGSKDDESFNIPSKEGKDVNVDLEFSYRFDENRLPVIYTTFRGKSVEIIKETWMRGKIKAWASEMSSKYTVIDIYSEGRMSLNRDMFNHLKAMFQPYGIVIESANFSRIAVDPHTEKTIQENINAKQALVKTQLEIQEIRIQKEGAKEAAEKRKIVIDLENYEVISKAKAEAEANELRNKTITSEMIELEKIRKWDGKLSQVQGSSTPIIKLEK